MATLSCRPLELSTRLRTRTQGNLPPRVAITGLRGESLYPLVPLRDSTWPRFVHDWNFQHTYVRGPPTMSGGSPASEVESLYPLVPLRDSTWPRFRACHGSFQYAYVRGPPPTMSGGSPAFEVESLYPLVPLRDSTWPHLRACHRSFQHTYEAYHPP